MAKAKKTETKKKPATDAGATPLVDTSLAAEAAAKMVANRAALAAAGKSQSLEFKQLKDSLAKPHLQSLGSMLNSTGEQKKTGLPSAFGANKQVGHNQTFGADVNRKNIPRRTSGG